jgi:AraC family transcriptional activator FtrA
MFASNCAMHAASDVTVDGLDGWARHRVAIVVLDRTMALDTAVALQTFGNRPSAFRRIRDEDESPYELLLCGASRTTLRTVGLSVDELRPFSDIATADTVIVPGLDDPGRRRDEEALAQIAAAGERGTRLVGLCTGAFVLGHAGVLSGHRVTTHWAMADDFRELFPDVELLDDELYVDDGQVLTSGGMLAGADLCLYLLGKDRGQSYANDVSRLLVSPPHRVGGQAQYRTPKVSRADGTFAPLVEWALEHLAEDLTIDVLAAKANISPRTLARRFETETGRGPMRWLTERRVARARALLEETDLTVSEVAFACGFGSLQTFRRQFSSETGTTPRAYRLTFTSRLPHR